MNKIGDFLDIESKRKIIKKSLQPGRIVHIRAKFNSGNPADKLCVIIQSDPFLFYTISSFVSNFVRHNKDRNALQIPIDQNDYECIEKPSVINCIELQSKTELENVISQILSNPDYYNVRDYLKYKHKQQIFKKVLSSKIISNIDKKLVLEALS